MLILNSLRNIYVHLHKNGGTSIECSLSPLLKWNDILLGSTPEGEAMQHVYAYRFGLDKHSSAARIKSLVGSEIWNSYLKWATVRSPYSRLASLYGYAASLVEPELTTKYLPFIASKTATADWLASDGYPKSDPWYFPLVRAYLASRHSNCPFSEFLRAPALQDEPAFLSQFEQLAEHGNLIVDRCARLETLSSTWPSLCSEMNIPCVSLNISNETPAEWKKETKDLFTLRDDIDFVNTHFSEDFRCFGYEKA
jgi:hypothetical protein